MLLHVYLSSASFASDSPLLPCLSAWTRISSNHLEIYVASSFLCYIFFLQCRGKKKVQGRVSEPAGCKICFASQAEYIHSPTMKRDEEGAGERWSRKMDGDGKMCKL